MLWGGSYPGEGAPPYWPWVQALRGYVRNRDADRLRSELGSAGPEVAKVVSEVRDRLPDLPQPTPGDPAQERFRLFDGVATFIRNASTAQPMVIVLDNIHFADHPSLLLMQFLVQEARETRLLMIGTYRDVEQGVRNPLDEVLAGLAQERRYHHLSLKGLSKEDTGKMVDALTGITPSAGLLDAIYNATEGVPLYIDEMVNLLTEQGKLNAAPAGREGATSLGVPRSLRGVVGQRLERLSEEARQVLTIAALVGREFDYQVLKELTDKEEDTILELLDGVVASRLIEEVAGAVGKYRFHHGLTREVLTGELSATRRVRLHGRIGEALEKSYGRDAERHATELAYHYGQAATLSGAQEKAVRYSVLAAKNAAAAYAYEDVIRHYEAALGPMEETREGPTTGQGEAFGQDEVSLRRGLATAHRAVYRNGDAFRNFRLARQLAHERGDGQAAAELALEQVQTGSVPNDVQVRALTMGLQAVPDQESETAALLHAAMVLPIGVVEGEEVAQEHYQSAVEIATSNGYRFVEFRLAGVAFFRAVWALDLRQAPVLEKRLDELQAELGRTMLMSSSARSMWRLNMGDVAGAKEQAQRYLEHARRARDAYLTNRNVVQLASTHLWMGGFKEALAVCELGVGQERGDVDWGIEQLRSLAAEAIGDLAGARSSIEPVLEITRRLRAMAIVAMEAAYLIGIERRLGDRARADALYAEVVAMLPDLKTNVRYASSIYALIAVEAATRGDKQVMARCEEVLTPYDGIVGVNVGDPLWSITVGLVLGTMAGANGRWDEAVGYIERAAAFCQEKGLPVELAHCRLALADALNGRNAAGDHQKAGTLLDQAMADYQRLGMPLYVQDVLARKEILRA